GEGRWLRPHLPDREAQAGAGRDDSGLRLTGPLGFSPNGEWVVAAGQGDKLFVLAFPGGEVVKVFDDARATTALGFLRNGAGFLWGGDDGSLRVYDLTTWKVSRTLAPHVGGPVLWVECSPDGRFALTVGRGDAVRVWDLERPGERPRDLIAQEPGSNWA